MESKTYLAFLLLAFTCLISTGQSYVFYVGGKDGWVQSPSESYAQWAQRNRFQVNDTLVFVYKKGEDSVLQVSTADFLSCNRSNPVAKLDSGNDSFKLGQSGHFFFISGTPGRCENGQKLDIIVLAIRNKSPPSPSPPSPPPSGALPPSPSPSSEPSPSPSSEPSPSPSPSSSPSPSPEPSPSPSAGSPPPSGISPSGFGPGAPSSSATPPLPPSGSSVRKSPAGSSSAVSFSSSVQFSVEENRSSCILPFLLLCLVFFFPSFMFGFDCGVHVSGIRVRLDLYMSLFVCFSSVCL